MPFIIVETREVPYEFRYRDEFHKKQQKPRINFNFISLRDFDIKYVDKRTARHITHEPIVTRSSLFYKA